MSHHRGCPSPHLNVGHYTHNTSHYTSHIRHYITHCHIVTPESRRQVIMSHHRGCPSSHLNVGHYTHITSHITHHTLHHILSQCHPGVQESCHGGCPSLLSLAPISMLGITQHQSPVLGTPRPRPHRATCHALDLSPKVKEKPKSRDNQSNNFCDRHLESDRLTEKY